MQETPGHEPLRFVPPEAFDEPPAQGALWQRLTTAIGITLALVILASVGFLLLREPAAEPGPATAGPPAESARSAPYELAGDRPFRSGRLVLGTELPPDARIEIDGEIFAGGIGQGTPIRLAAGVTHHVVVQVDGYHPWSAEIYLPWGETVRLEPRLVPATEPARRDGDPVRRADVGSTSRGPAEVAADVRSPENEPVRDEPQRRAEPRAAVAASGPGEPRDRAAESASEYVPATRTPATGAADEVGPRLPPEVLDSLVLRLEQGRLLHEIGRHPEAVGAFRRVIDGAEQASSTYRSTASLRALLQQADSALQAVERECRRQELTDCG